MEAAMSQNYFLGCRECHRKVHLGVQGLPLYGLAADPETAARIMEFISIHKGCEGGVVAGDDSKEHQESDVALWPEDHGEPTARMTRFMALKVMPPPIELCDCPEALGLPPMPSREEREEIHRASQIAGLAPGDRLAFIVGAFKSTGEP
jgi:hypothetical protein